MQNNMPKHKRDFFERVTASVGSVESLFVHTVFFMAAFAAGIFGFISWTTMLLVVTTLVSLEAIYLAIFIQMTVNRHAHELRGVSEDVEDIQEDIEEISEDVGELGEDVEDIQEDIKEMTDEEKAEEARKRKQAITLDQLTTDIQRVLADIEDFKKP